MLTIDQRVEVLLKQMSLEEKIGQLNQYNWKAIDERTRSGSLLNEIREGKVGSFFNVSGTEQLAAIQKIAVEQSRLKVPLLFAHDIIHGYKTIFPVPLAEAATWDLDLIEKSARIAAIEASAAGLHWTFAPMVDIARDPRWGRIMEGAGEDPYLGSLIAAARVRGFQCSDLSRPDTILACAKHFAAYGAAEAGREYNTTDMSLLRLWEVYLPPFKAAVDAGVATVMNSFNELNGIPSSANKYLVTDVLKNKWEFDGFVISDYKAFFELIAHGYAEDRAHAADLAINAGSDMDMQSGVFTDHLAGLVTSGRVKQERLDDAVRRVLKAKFALGLFDDPYRYCDPDREKKLILHPDHIKFAREIAAKSIVLLKNDNKTLPLKKDVKTIAVIGALADSKIDMLGSWHAEGDSDVVVTILEGIKAKVAPGTTVLFAPGYQLHGVAGADQIDYAVETAERADLVILTVGENGDMTGECTSRADIGLPYNQDDLAAEIAKLNVPTVVLLANGRPLTVKNLRDSFPAILETWFLGTQAGNAVADVLFGDVNPSGKLPVTFPLALGQVPICYNHKNTGRPLHAKDTPVHASMYSDIPNDPLYPFGFGLSYTTFEYSDVRLNKTAIKNGESLRVSVTVKNTGRLAGDEIVQVYIRDLVASVTRPVKELKRFCKIRIEPGQSRNVEFFLTASDLAFCDQDLNFKTEPGRFVVFVGPNSRDLKQASFGLE